MPISANKRRIEAEAGTYGKMASQDEVPRKRLLWVLSVYQGLSPMLPAASTFDLSVSIG